jgi:hypothetical protein
MVSWLAFVIWAAIFQAFRLNFKVCDAYSLYFAPWNFFERIRTRCVN